MDMLNTAIVGAGLSGLACARRLAEAGIDVALFEKSRGPGGRLANRRLDDTDIDFGAPYFTARSPAMQNLCQRWVEAGIAAPWPTTFGVWRNGVFAPEANPAVRFVGTPRMTSLSRALAEGLTVHVEQRIGRLSHRDQRWQLHGADNDHIIATAERLVLAIPAPQAQALLQPLHPELAGELPDMLPCDAAMLILNTPVTPPFHTFFCHHDVLSFVTCNSDKPGRNPSPQTWLLHANADWSRQHADAHPSLVLDAMRQAFSHVIAQALDIRTTELHRWRYAKAAGDWGGQPYWDPSWQLGLCGDWAGSQRVEGAWESGDRLAGQILSADGTA